MRLSMVSRVQQLKLEKQQERWWGHGPNSIQEKEGLARPSESAKFLVKHVEVQGEAMKTYEF